MSPTDKLATVVERHGIRAKKFFGQNFIFDKNLLAKIAGYITAIPTAAIVEIGSGPGGLTNELLKSSAKKIYAIEIDRACIAALKDIESYHDRRLSIVERDILTLDLDELVNEAGAYTIAGNLPFNIASEIILRWMTLPQWPPRALRMVVLLQQEFADRLVAKVGTAAYGRLTIITQLTCSARILYRLSKESFVPRPKVNAALVELVALPQRETKFAETLQVVKAAFAGRRKMIRASLMNLPNLSKEATIEWLKNANIKDTSRAQELAPADFIRLAATRMW